MCGMGGGVRNYTPNALQLKLSELEREYFFLFPYRKCVCIFLSALLSNFLETKFVLKVFFSKSLGEIICFSIILKE